MSDLLEKLEQATVEELQRVADVVLLLGRSINDLRLGRLDPKIGNGIGYLSSILLRALEGDELRKELEDQKKQVQRMRVPSCRLA
jgi:hypothetical protein